MIQSTQLRMVRVDHHCTLCSKQSYNSKVGPYGHQERGTASLETYDVTSRTTGQNQALLQA